MEKYDRNDNAVVESDYDSIADIEVSDTTDSDISEIDNDINDIDVPDTTDSDISEIDNDTNDADYDTDANDRCRVKEPGIMLTYDDLLVDYWYKAHMDIFKEKGIKVTFYLSHLYKLSDNPTQLSELKELSDYGHEMACHTMHHHNLSTFLETETEDDYINEEIKPFLELSKEFGFKIQNFSYPNGVGTPEMDEKLLKYFKTLRYTYSPVSGSGPIFFSDKSDRIITGGCADVICNSKKESITAALEKAKKENSVVMILGHEITNKTTGDNPYYTTYDTINWIISEAERLGLKFYTVSEVFSSECGENPIEVSGNDEIPVGDYDDEYEYSDEENSDDDLDRDFVLY